MFKYLDVFKVRKRFLINFDPAKNMATKDNYFSNSLKFKIFPKLTLQRCMWGPL